MRFTVLISVIVCLICGLLNVRAGELEDAVKNGFLPHHLTDEEKDEWRSRPMPELRRTPPSGFVVHPPEFGPMDGTLLRWPVDWTALNPMYCQMVDEIADVATVYMLVQTEIEKTYVQNTLADAGVPQGEIDAIQWLLKRTDSVWARDYGPNAIYEDSIIRGITDYLYYPSRPFDNQVPAFLANSWSWPLYQENLFTEGGNFVSDGCGNCFATSWILEENPSMTEDEIIQIMSDYLGCDEYHIIPRLIGTIGHIDMSFKFLDLDTILIAEVDPENPNYDILENHVAFLETLTACNGNPYEIIRIYSHTDLSYMRTYTNALTVNGTALIPTYTEPEDALAVQIFQDAGYEAIAVESSIIIPASGAVHCVTKEIPAPCTPPADPSNVSISVPGNNQIQVSWDIGIEQFCFVYRSMTDCDTDLIKVDVSDTGMYLDTNVSGDTTYYYKIKAYDICYSDFSVCVSETATGDCTLPPTFAGLENATNLQTETCSIQLDWSDATLNCGSQVKYNIYRSTAPEFIPGPENMIDSCVDGLSYIDSSEMFSHMMYYYVVRAEDIDATGTGPCSGGSEDFNLSRQNAVTTGPVIGNSYFEDFESGMNGWTLSPAGLWHLADDTPCASPYDGYYSPTHSWYYGQESDCTYDTGYGTEGNLLSPVIVGIKPTSNLSFFYSRNVEFFADGGYDKTIVAVTVNGVQWITVWEKDCSDPSPDIWESSGDISLAEWAGQDIQIRFRFNSIDETYNAYTGWMVDDVQITDVDITDTCGPLCLHHGDVTLNGEVTAADAQLSFMIVLGAYTATPEEMCAADCDADSQVTSGDSQGIFALALGMDTCADQL